MTPSVPVQSAPESTDHLATLTRLSRLRERAVSAESAAITAARSAGLSWDVIARATGLNRETLRRRYGDG